MKNVIIALAVTLAVIGSAAAAPVVTVIGVISATKDAVGFIDDSIKTVDRKDTDYVVDVRNVPEPEKIDVSEEEYEELTVATDYAQEPSESTPIYKEDQKDEKKINLLLFVSDPFDLFPADIKGGTTLVTFDLNSKKIKAATINNDLYVPINGHGWNRLGAAYEYGGIGMYINTVNEVFDLDIQYYAFVDMTYSNELVDWAGGIDIELTENVVDFYKGKYDFTVGMNHLNGEQFTDLIKNRKEFEHDLNSIDKESLTGALKNVNADSVVSLLKAVSNLLKTNVKLSLLVKLIPMATSLVDNTKMFDRYDPFNDCKKAIVSIEETGERISVMLMENIEQIRKIFKEKIYG